MTLYTITADGRPIIHHTLSRTEAKKAAREELKRHRSETQRYKQKYFEYYDDVKINHREDW